MKKMQKKILYIAGLGHSGSTIVDIVLGNNSKFFSCGELTNVFEDAYIKNQICSCGKRGFECPYWQAIKHEWLKQSPIGIEEFIRLIKKFETNSLLPWARFVFNYYVFTTREFRRYLNATVLLLDIIYQKNDAEVLIDSSKRVLRLEILRKFCNYKILPLHLVRDLKGVMASDAKTAKTTIHKQYKFFQTYIRYVIINLQIKVVLLKSNSKYLFYDEFLSNPEKNLIEVGHLFGIRTQEAISRIKLSKKLKFDHIISGSYIRTKPEIILQVKPNQKWKKVVPQFQVKLSNVITLLINYIIK